MTYYPAPGPRVYFLAHYPDASIPLSYSTEAAAFYVPSWPGELGPQPDPATVAAYSPPALVWPPPKEQPPLTDVEMGAGKMAQRRQAREDLIFSEKSGLVGSCYAWLQRACTVTGQEGTVTMTAGEALQAGQGLCATYGGQLRRWIDWGIQDFFTAMSSPDPDRAWLERIPEGESKSIREIILDRIYLASFGVARS